MADGSPHADRAALRFRAARSMEILSLRAAVLIRGTDRSDPTFAGDDAETTRHYGVFDEAGRCLACLTLMREDLDGRPGIQLRGMAVDPTHHGRGLGRRLLDFALADADPEQRFVIWCNARQTAVGFYEKTGWRAVGERFDITGVGPHYRMVLHREQRPSAET